MTIVAGQEEKKFYVHANLLRQNSDYFRPILSGNWKGDKSEVDLRDEDPDVVETVVDWMYHGTLPMLTNTPLDMNLCLKCYKFAETRLMYSMKNTIMDVLRKYFAQHDYQANPPELRMAYAFDLRDTQIGTFILKSIVSTMMFQYDFADKQWCEQLAEVCEEKGIGSDVVREIMVFQKNSYSAPEMGDGCFFHDHSNGSSCQKSWEGE